MAKRKHKIAVALRFRARFVDPPDARLLKEAARLISKHAPLPTHHAKVAIGAGRGKGHAFERWVGKKFRKIFPEARRHLEFQKEEAAAGVDLVHLGRYRVQCKRMRKYASITAIFEVKVCPIEGGCPILVTKGDRQEAMAVLPFEELLLLISKSERC